MTPPYEQNPSSTDKRLEDILRTVRSIDGKVDEVLDTLNEHLNRDKYDAIWNGNGCENGEDYCLSGQGL
jgi:hypothetical protein